MPGAVRDVFVTFLRLGVTAFGGPIAHLAHFRRVVVQERKWLSEASYADLVALAQFLPGPTSSQVGVLLGFHRAGWWGALAAWTAFTLPSALALMLAAVVLAHHGPGPWVAGLLAAVVGVVAVAVAGMARSLCPDLPRALIALGVAAVVILVPGVMAPLAALAVAGLAGLALPARTATLTDLAPALVPSRTASWALLATVVLIAGLLLAAGDHPVLVVLRTCFLAGGLVLGGGHVVLPLLRDPLVGAGLVDDATFLAGYGAAQVIPGPLFTVSAWIGTTIGGPLLGGGALVAMFLPGVLLVLGCLRFYRQVLQGPTLSRVSGGVQAGVVGLLGGTWVSVIVPEGITDLPTAGVAVLATVLLAWGRLPPALVVLGCGAAGLVFF